MGAVADCGCACEAECATHTVVRNADHVRCKRTVNGESMRNALHVLRLVLVLLLLVTVYSVHCGRSCLRRISRAVHQCGGSVQGHQRQRHQFQQSVNPKTAATTRVQSSVRDAWTSAGVLTRRAVQQVVQGRAASLGAATWSSVASSHSVGARRQRRPEQVGRGLHGRPA